MRRIKVLDLYPFDRAAQDRLDAISPRLRIEHRNADTQEHADAIQDTELEVLLSSYAPSDFRRTPALRWIASETAGIEQILAKDPWSRRITVTNGSGLHAVAMGEYALTAMLLVTQRVTGRLLAQREHRWPAWRSAEWLNLAGTRLHGSVVALVGYGSVGREIARLAKAFGARVLAVKARPHDRLDPGYREEGSGDPDGTLPDRIVGVDEIREVLAEADFVVIAAPLTPRTKGLVDVAFLSAMRPNAWLVNVGRGGHVVEGDLMHALHSGRIAGAVLDVFADEPLPSSSPFWDQPNVILTPHLAGVAGPAQFWSATAELMAENLRRYAAGEQLLNVIDPGRAY